MVIIGIEKVDYKSKKTGKQVIGFILHTGTAIADGYKTERYFVKDAHDEYGDLLTVGDNVELLFNRYGSVERVCRE